MMQHDTQVYHSFSRFVHWLMALLMLGLILVGFFMVQMDSAPLKFEIYGWHKSLGVTVLLLAFLRVGWRLYKKAPMALSAHKNWEKILSKTIHIVLYVAILVMPLSGWAMSSAAGYPVSFFGLFDVPNLVPKDKNILELARSVHEYAALGIIGALGLHVVGALKHHFIDKDATLTRMSGRPVLGFVAIVLLGFATFMFIRGELKEHQAEAAKAEEAIEAEQAQ